jgi:hypothetical protein
MRGLEDGVSLVAQNNAHHCAQRRFVVDDEDSPHAPASVEGSCAGAALPVRS